MGPSENTSVPFSQKIVWKLQNFTFVKNYLVAQLAKYMDKLLFVNKIKYKLL